MHIKTSESVFRGHPDKVCDQVADGILDAILAQDKEARVAIECLIKDDLFVIAGEVTTTALVDYILEARRILDDIGYDGDSYRFITKISAQSSDIKKGVDALGAGDQGIMYGYATNETEECLPLPYLISRNIAKRMDEVNRKHPDIFGLDGKCQVSIVYNDQDKAVHALTIVVSAQTKLGVNRSTYEPFINEEIKAVVPENLIDESTLILINPTGEFVKGGSYADSGLTGRKLQVDNYGTLVPHGGGAFSGKDYTKVDRSGAYYCRYVAKAIVKAGLAKTCEVSVAYAIGVPFPVAINIKAKGSSHSNDELRIMINKVFDFSPAYIISELKLKEVTYRSLSEYGHFGWKSSFWEIINEELIVKIKETVNV
jgi:S-adenosylmethionine synthetase